MMFSVTDAPRPNAMPRGLEMQLLLGRVVEGLALMSGAPDRLLPEHLDASRRVIELLRSGVADARNERRSLYESAGSLGVVAAGSRVLGAGVVEGLQQLAETLEAALDPHTRPVGDELLALIGTLVSFHDAISTGGLPADVAACRQALAQRAGSA